MAKKNILGNSLTEKDFLAVLILIVNAFSWYFPLYVFLEDILSAYIDFMMLLAVFGLHYIAIIGFAIANTYLIKKISSRNLFLSFWMIIGAIVSALVVIIEANNSIYVWLMPFLLGASLGLGFPSCLAYFGDFSVGESRGRIGGIVWCVSGICMLLLGLLASFLPFTVSILLFSAWRIIGLVLFLLVKPNQTRKENSMDVPFRSILVDKSFILYLIPWTMFCLVNFLEIPITNILFGSNIAYFVPVAEFGIGGVTALIGGWVADSVGRKRVIIFGFIMLGIGYAVLGLFPDIILSWYLYIILDGAAWGIFAFMFFLVMWSELAGNRIKEKYYLIGVLPFLVSSYIQILFTPYAESIPITTAFSLASFFLFLAVLPLLFAPETLPEKQIELRRLRGYMEKARNLREKHQEKSD